MVKPILRPLLLLFPVLLTAQAPFYIGTWNIESAEPAPWATPAMLGKPLTGTFSQRSIAGPGVLACRQATYKLQRVPPEGLFQGTLGEGEAARAAAQRLGFASPEIETLITGCEHIIDYHFFDHQRAAFALDNRIYRIRKAVGAGAKK